MVLTFALWFLQICIDCRPVRTRSFASHPGKSRKRKDLPQGHTRKVRFTSAFLMVHIWRSLLTLFCAATEHSATFCLDRWCFTSSCSTFSVRPPMPRFNAAFNHTQTAQTVDSTMILAIAYVRQRPWRGKRERSEEAKIQKQRQSRPAKAGTPYQSLAI